MRKTAVILEEREILGKQFKIYGTPECPLFLAKDVAQCIEHSDTSIMLRKVDDEEKLIQTMFVSGQHRDYWFLTEDGLYEVLFQSRKPIAKMFKREVKAILKQIRATGGYIPVTEEMDDKEIMAKALSIMQNTLQRKDKIIEEKDAKIKYLESNIKLNPYQVSMGVSALKQRYYELTGKIGWAASPDFDELKRKLFKKCGVSKWTEINQSDFDYMLNAIKSIK